MDESILDKFQRLYRNLHSLHAATNLLEEEVNALVPQVVEQFQRDIEPYVGAFNEKYREDLRINYTDYSEAKLEYLYGDEDELEEVEIELGATYELGYPDVTIPMQYFTHRQDFIDNLKSFSENRSARRAENERLRAQEKVERLTRELAEAQDFLKNL